jgi:cysteine desulfuration protein SufE
MTIKEKINFYKDSLNWFEETMDKYKFLLDQGKKSKPFPEEFRQENFKVQGCQAQVWLVPDFKNNKLNFHSDSDAFISKGMVTILIDIYGNNTPSDILQSDFESLKTLELDSLLTQGRRNGFFAMLKKIQEYAVFYKSHAE